MKKSQGAGAENVKHEHGEGNSFFLEGRREAGNFGGLGKPLYLKAKDNIKNSVSSGSQLYILLIPSSLTILLS